MYSILDIDLDYFNQMSEAAHHLEQLLTWAACPVSIVVERHNHAFHRWRKRWQTHNITPSHILCRVHWMVQHPIDSPAMWLDDETWDSLRHRFSHGTHRPALWPKPDVVSVCTSPDFVTPSLAENWWTYSQASWRIILKKHYPNDSFVSIAQVLYDHIGR